MLRGPEVDFDGVPLFWPELFDRSTKTSVDGSSCYNIKEAVTIFDDFMSQRSHHAKRRPGAQRHVDNPASHE
jgi:hypothetical protein